MSDETKKATPRRSRFRTVLNACWVFWFVVCGLLLLSAVVGIVLSILGIYQGDPQNAESYKGVLKMCLLCGLVDIAVILYGRKYFRYAFMRIAELEQLERRGP